MLLVWLLVALSLLAHQLLLEPLGSVLTALLHGNWAGWLLLGILVWAFAGSHQRS